MCALPSGVETAFVYLAEQPLRPAAGRRGEINVDFVVLGRDGLLHEGFVEDLPVDFDLIVLLDDIRQRYPRSIWNETSETMRAQLRGRGRPSFRCRRSTP